MMSFAWWLSLTVGFLSLSQEILWVRLVSFAFQGIPHAFSFVLANFLIGIALGALVGKWFCERNRSLYAVAAGVLLLAGAIDLMMPAMAVHFLGRDQSSLPWLPLAVIGTAAIKSVLFPIAHHLGSNQSGPKVGSSVSRIYFGNIIGSTLGPIITGFYLLDRLTVEQCFVVVGSACIVLSAATALVATRGFYRAGVVTLCTVPVLILAQSGIADTISRIAVRTPSGDAPITHIIQNKHGILHTVKDERLGDIVFGGNVYDGRVNTDVKVNSNGLERLYILAALHPRPRRILVIGMSTGAWTRLLSGFPGAEHIDVVEINPGYLDLVNAYPVVSPVLRDPRIDVHIDDGRRWLKRHPGAMYDLIVQNTTFHWRSNSTNLLSLEYFLEVGRHLLPGGIFAANTTSSLDVYRTAQEAFSHAFKYRNFVYAGDRDFRASRDAALERLRVCRIGDQPAFLPEQFERGGVAYELAKVNLEPVARILAAQSSVPIDVITDQNLLVEYRHGHAVTFAPLRRLLPDNPETMKTDR